MKIHEYQAKALFREFNIPVPEGKVATSVDEAVQAAQSLNSQVMVVKAQIHAGGRGKGGGVAVCKSLDEVREAAQRILGMQLVTHQTGPEGQPVKTVLIEAGSKIAKELYASIVLDRATARPVFLVSTEGGMDIEAVAEETPDKITRVFIHPALGLQPFQAKELVYALNIPKAAQKQAMALFANLYQMFLDTDCSLVEVNPLVITEDEQMIALDAKVNFDSNALYRHPQIVELRDTDEEDPLEVDASNYNLNYIRLEGTVGCMVNGAGLAMGTMDIIKLYGAAPANFLDVGGSATGEALENAFRILISDKNVRVVFINIFGGILRCDKLARGVVDAARKLEMSLPIVIRMKGTNMDEGKQILADSGLRFDVYDTMDEAARRVAELAGATVGV